MKANRVNVIGAGLAGVEAANILTRYGIDVTLYEMKPKMKSPAHKSDLFAELVCSNSLKSSLFGSAAGMLKAEMELMGSLVVEAAKATSVPAGGALAVDRTMFSQYITEKIKSNDKITIISDEYKNFPEENTIIATGPLTSDSFAEKIKERCKALSFYDAAAPIITAESIDKSIAFEAARYDKGEPDYLNCPMNEDEYNIFYENIISAETAPLNEFDKLNVYEGCMPIEVLAKRGKDSIRFGPMKPVGLINPLTGKRAYAIVQLRKENREGTIYNIVGFQTNLKFPEQKRVFSLIPGLQNAEFMRYGVMHRNTFLNSPDFLDINFMMRGSKNIYFAGQITGVEGYSESAASGLIAGHSLARKMLRLDEIILPKTTMMYALSAHVSESVSTNFQPMGANMGILPPLDEKIRDKRQRYEKIAARGLHDLTKAVPKF